MIYLSRCSTCSARSESFWSWQFSFEAATGHTSGLQQLADSPGHRCLLVQFYHSLVLPSMSNDNSHHHWHMTPSKSPILAQASAQSFAGWIAALVRRMRQSLHGPTPLYPLRITSTRKRYKKYSKLHMNSKTVLCPSSSDVCCGRGNLT